MSDGEPKNCHEVIEKLKGTGQKVRRAQILLKSDADGQHGLTWKFPKLSTAAPRPLKISGGDLSKLVLNKRLIEKNQQPLAPKTA